MSMITSPLFWEWFNIWLVEFLKDLYHEIKMVALRGNGFVSHGGQSEVVGNGGQNCGGIGSARVHVQYMPGPSKHEPPRYPACAPAAASSGTTYRLLPQSTPNSYPRASTPHRSECYHPAGSTASGYLPGAQPTLGPQQSLRPQPTPQPSAPPAPPAPAAPQLDMSKPALAGHNYVPQQSQSPQSRPQYSNFSYRAQHGARPNTHPRQQQPYLGGAGNNTAAPVVYHHPTLVFQPHMGLPQGYQQPRSSSSGFYQYVSPYLGYGTPTGHTPPCEYIADYYPNNQPLGGSGVATSSARAGAPLVGPQPTAAAPPAPLPHAPPPPHLHSAMPGVRPTLTKRSHRVPIIDPVTQQEVLSELYNNDTYFVPGEMNERQTPQPVCI
ncbi:PREDICTED: extensin-like isoform X1 [Papilio polytes]|uniref:extensin-like isoform X1 n=1 Tax=Papilio polytes TaxID=76194 RepID=UPI0006766235|nr:PREDICTED: extensin-like isoform X1 [Papilio polytes]